MEPTVEELTARLRELVEDQGLDTQGAVARLMEEYGREGVRLDPESFREPIRRAEAQSGEDYEWTPRSDRADTNEDGQVSEPEQRDETIGRATDDDPTNDPEAEEVQDIAAALGSDPELLEYFGNQPPNPADLADLVDEYNEMNPSDPVVGVGDLIERWRFGDPDAVELVESIAPARTEDYVSVTVGKQQEVRVRGINYRALQENFGDGFARNQALIYGVRERTGATGNGVGIPASALVGALAVAGTLDRARRQGSAQTASSRLDDTITLNAFELYRQRTDEFIRPRGETEAERAEWVRENLGNDRAFQQAREEVESNTELVQGLEQEAESVSTTWTDPKFGTTQSNTERSTSRATTSSRSYQRYYEEFRNHGLALVAMRNLKLARQIYQTGEIPPEHANLVQQVFLDGGYSREQWTSQGDAFDGDAFYDLLGATLQGGAAGASASASAGNGEVRIVNTPDDATLEESMRNLWRGWFRREPTEEELTTFVGEIDAMFTAEEQRLTGVLNAQQQSAGRTNIFQPQAPGQQGPAVTLIQQRDIDPASELIQRARRSAMYKEMFGRKPEHMSEEEYAGRFESTARSFAGNSVTQSDAVGAGMRTGDTNTTVGQLFMDQQTFDNNSTFRDRLFNAARIIRDAL